MARLLETAHELVQRYQDVVVGVAIATVWSLASWEEHVQTQLENGHPLARWQPQPTYCLLLGCRAIVTLCHTVSRHVFEFCVPHGHRRSHSRLYRSLGPKVSCFFMEPRGLLSSQWGSILNVPVSLCWTCSTLLVGFACTHVRLCSSCFSSTSGTLAIKC